jgi:hypothetical protein
MKRGAVVVLAILLAVGLGPPQAAASPARGGGVHRFHPGHHFHRFHHHGRAFFFGFGVGALVTAPWWWYPAPYAYPMSPDPYSVPPPPVYWYYCQDPPGYYPYVPQCPGGWLTVVPPSAPQ